MKRIRLMLLVLLLVSPIAQGVNEYKGTDMLKHCKVYIDKLINNQGIAKVPLDIAESHLCLGFIVGIHNSHDAFTQWGDMEKEFCTHKDVDVNQLVLVAVKYLESHPEDLHYAASSLVINALKEAFPCN